MKTTLISISLLLLFGCSSVPEPVAKSTLEEQEWQQLKPSIKRLVALEGDLKLLIGELANLKQSEQSTLPAGNIEVDTITKPEFEEKLVMQPQQNEPEFAKSTDSNQEEREQTPQIDKVVTKDPKQVAKTESKDPVAVDAKAEPIHQLSEPEVNAELSFGSEYALQLASLNSYTAAANTWSRYTLKQQEITNYQPLVEKVTVNGKLYHRLKLAGFQSKSEAKRLCSALVLEGIQCYLTNTNGESLQMLANR